MARKKDKLETLKSVKTWTTVNHKEVARIKMNFERIFQKELHNWQNHPDISHVIDDIVDLESTIDSLNFYVNDAIDNLTE